MDYKFKARYKGFKLDETCFDTGVVYGINIEVDKDFLKITGEIAHDGIIRTRTYERKDWSSIMVYWDFQFKDLFQEVLLERVRQDHKFGKRTQHSMIWHTILSEETGEVAREICDSGFAWKPESNYRKELIEAAAVALAAVQDYDLSGEYGQENKQ